MNSRERYLPFSRYASQEVTSRDEELLLAARAGSHAAFAELRNIHANRLYKRILSMVKSREDAEDALQDTFFRAYLALPSFEGRSRLSSWLMRIAINSALMILRKRRTRPEISVGQSGTADEELSLEVRDSALGPEQLYDQHQRCDVVLSAIQRLGPKLRKVIGLRVLRESSMQEIAYDLGLSVPSVKARLHRARMRLVQSPAFHEQDANPNSSNRRALTCSHDCLEKLSLTTRLALNRLTPDDREGRRTEHLLP